MTGFIVSMVVGGALGFAVANRRQLAREFRSLPYAWRDARDYELRPWFRTVRRAFGKSKP